MKGTLIKASTPIDSRTGDPEYARTPKNRSWCVSAIGADAPHAERALDEGRMCEIDISLLENF